MACAAMRNAEVVQISAAMQSFTVVVWYSSVPTLVIQRPTADPPKETDK